MKKIIASLLCLLLCASLACCGTETNENSAVSSETASSEGSVSESSVAESDIADSTTEDDAARFPAAEEPTAQSPAFYTLNSMTEPVILLPFHTAAEEAIPQWQDEILNNLQQIGQFMDDLSWVEQHGDAHMLHCRLERTFEERLMADG